MKFRSKPSRLDRLRMIVWVVAGLGLLALLPERADAGELSDTIKRVRPSIVAVGTYQKTRRPPARLLGTGFVVGDGSRVLTNAHVVPASMDEKNKEFLTVFIGRGKRVSVRRAKVSAADKGHDVALLKFNGGPLPALKLAEDDDVEEGQEIAFTGFPIGAVLGLYPVTHRGIVSAITPIAIPLPSTRKLDSVMIKRLQGGFEVLQLDATAYPGNSGSPLFDPATGKVVGIVSSVFVKGSKEKVLKEPSGITYAIPIRYGRALLSGAGSGN